MGHGVYSETDCGTKPEIAASQRAGDGASLLAMTNRSMILVLRGARKRTRVRTGEHGIYLENDRAHRTEIAATQNVALGLVIA